MATFTDPDRFQKAYEQAPKRLFRALEERWRPFVRWFATNRMPRAMRQGGLHRRSGALADSFGSDVQGSTVDDLTALVYTTSRYAPLHEFGGQVVPTQRTYLTIPLDRALTGEAGATRSRAEGWGRTNTFVGPDDQGRLYIWLREAPPPAGWKPGMDDPNVVPLFRLVRSVSIPARLGFMRAWAETEAERDDMVAEAVDEALDGLGEG